MRVRSSTRTNLTISDKQGLTLKLNEVGGELETAELQQMRHAVESRSSSAQWHSRSLVHRDQTLV